MTHKIKFSVTRPFGDRIHYITEEDIRVVLSRLPEELWHRLREVHLNDQSRGVSRLGYVDQGRKEISLCALPPRISLARFLVKGQAPGTYGAKRGSQWPHFAVRRFMLYGTFLHELGHLQVINEDKKSARRKFAMDTLAFEFAVRWRKTLWSKHFSHSDPVHNRPSEEEFALLNDDSL
jgi:hypothetical protein